MEALDLEKQTPYWSQQTNKIKLGIDKIDLYAKDPYQFFLIKRESTRLNHLNDSKDFIEYSNDMDDI